MVGLFKATHDNPTMVMEEPTDDCTLWGPCAYWLELRFSSMPSYVGELISLTVVELTSK